MKRLWLELSFTVRLRIFRIILPHLHRRNEELCNGSFFVGCSHMCVLDRLRKFKSFCPNGLAWPKWNQAGRPNRFIYFWWFQLFAGCNIECRMTHRELGIPTLSNVMSCKLRILYFLRGKSIFVLIGFTAPAEFEFPHDLVLHAAREYFQLNC